MARTLVLSVVALVMSVAACSSQSAPTPGAASASASPAPSGVSSQGTPTQAAAGSGNTLVDAAAAVTDPCSLMPVALAKQLVPKELGPQAQASPLSCQVTD